MFVKNIALLAIAGLSLYGCGGGGTSTDSSTAVVETGSFIDSAVANVSFKTATRSGTTNANGEFTYIKGESVTFSIGDLIFPTVTASEIVTPISLAGATSIDNQQALNIARLLVSIDADGDPSNGITIHADAASAATAVDFNVDKVTFEANTAVTNLIANSGSVTTTIVSETVAKTHVEESLFNLAGTIVGTWQSADASHKLTLLADNTFEFIENDITRTTPENGVEKGTYSYNSGTGDITFNITVDTNDPGNGSGLGDIGTPSIISSVLSNNNNSMFIAGVITLTRSSKVVGVWKSATDHIMALFPDNTFIYFENDVSAPAPQNGVERGTYTYNLTTGDITFAVTIDTNDPGNDSGVGDIGSTKTFASSLSSDLKTLSFVGTPVTLSLDDEFYSKNGIVGVIKGTDGSYLIIFDSTAAGQVLMYTKDSGVEVATFTRLGLNAFELTKIFTDNSNVLGNTVTSIASTLGPVLTFSVAP